MIRFFSDPPSPRRRGTRLPLAAGLAGFLMAGVSQAQSLPAATAVDTPRPTTAEARKEVDAAVGRLTCAGVEITETGKGLRISGYVGSVEDADVLKAVLTALPPGSDLDAQVAVRPWPLCEALGIAGLAGGPEGNPHGRESDAPTLSFNRPSLVYRKGETLEITVTAGMPGHLTVDYIDGDGSVIHMVPMRLRRDDHVEAGRPVMLGVAKSATDRIYTISPPFGPAMILALVTRDPLFPADREEVEPAGPYLAGLRAALAALPADARGAVAVRSAVLTTVAE
ncbi:DUF4384 domain-containing protein [Azospirillum melinis]|uniref:DUF4384 domain-containing protein n=1 Tax=Azospirillum melinis TaxID=328839 RepID=A0ABX2KFY0_9PROT|nr:DUF4384 domain-containing protein [Azospirillum melinis]MBP2306789.1 hypothetical protein [Azospirillum melinis]NUA98703.1 DUF4384 domain-containing protein [Azospirillum melinis]